MDFGGHHRGRSALPALVALLLLAGLGAAAFFFLQEDAPIDPPALPIGNSARDGEASSIQDPTERESLTTEAYDPVAAGDIPTAREPAGDDIALKVEWDDGRPVTFGHVLMWQDQRQIDVAAIDTETGVARVESWSGVVELGVTGHGRGLWCARTDGAPGWRRLVLPRSSALGLEVNLDGEPARPGTRLALSLPAVEEVVPPPVEALRAEGLDELRYRGFDELEGLPDAVQRRLREDRDEWPGWLTVRRPGQVLVPGVTRPDGLSLKLPPGYRPQGSALPEDPGRERAWGPLTQHLVGRRLDLERLPAITGTLVSGHTGEPMRFAIVRVLDGGGKRVHLENRARTEHNGHFALVLDPSAGPAEDVWLVIRSMVLGYTVRRLEKVPATGLDVGQIECFAQGAVTCRVLDDEGKVLRGARAHAVPWGARTRLGTNRRGTMELAVPFGMKNVRYRFSARGAAQQDFVVPDPPPETWEVTLKAASKVVVRFRGAPADLGEGIPVRVAQEDPKAAPFWRHEPDNLGRGNQGDLVFKDVPPDVPLVVNAYREGRPFFTRRLTLERGERRVIEVTAPPRREGTVFGKIVDASGSPVAGTTLWIRRADGEPLEVRHLKRKKGPAPGATLRGSAPPFESSPTPTAKGTGQDGSYRRVVNDSGRWRIYAHHPEKGFAMREVSVEGATQVDDLVLTPLRWCRATVRNAWWSERQFDVVRPSGEVWALRASQRLGRVPLPPEVCELRVYAGGAARHFPIARDQGLIILAFAEGGRLVFRNSPRNFRRDGNYYAWRVDGSARPLELTGRARGLIQPGRYRLFGDPDLLDDLAVEFTIRPGQTTIISVP